MMMMNQHTSQRSSIAMPLGAMTRSGSVNQCVNLKKTGHLSTPAMTVAPQPDRICDYKLLPLMRLPNTGQWLMYSPADAENHSELYLATLGLEPEWLQQVEGEPRCAVATPTGAVVMLPDGPLHLTRSGNQWTTDSQLPLPMAVGITAAAKGTLTNTASPVTLDLIGSGPSATPSASSLERLRSSLLAAYSTLSAQALAGGVWIQPIGIRYRVLDRDGNELWSSPVSIVGIDGWQCASQITASLAGSGSQYSTSPLHLAAKAFSINVQVPGISPDSRAATVVVEATPQLHPILPDLLPRTLLSGISGNAPQLAAWMPGVQPDMAATVATHRMLLQSTVAEHTSLMTRIGRIELKANPRTVQLTPPTVPSVTREIAILKTATENLASQPKVTPDNPLSRIIAGGEKFTAGCVMQNGDTTVWGNIASVTDLSVLRFPAAAATKAGAWEAAMRIHLGASSYVTRYSGIDFCPTALAPLVAIPQPQATALTIYVKHLSTGAIAEATIDLSPTANGLMAYAVTNDLKPVALTPSDLTFLPAATANPHGREFMPGAVIAAPGAAPLKGVCAAVCSQGEIKALATAVKSRSSWDFSRCHLYAFATDGIYTVAVNTGRGNVSASRIDPRGVAHGGAVAHTPRGVVALAEGTPVICSASSVQSLPDPVTPPDTPLTQVAWHSSQNALYFTDTLGNVSVLTDEEWHHILLPERVENIAATSGGIWLACANGSYFTGDTAAQCHIQWQSDTLQASPISVLTLTVPLSATKFDGTLELRSHDGAGAAHSLPIVKLRISGQVNAPIRTRVIVPRRTGLALTLSGTASPDFHLLTPILTISKPGLR